MGSPSEGSLPALDRILVAAARGPSRKAASLATIRPATHTAKIPQRIGEHASRILAYTRQRTSPDVRLAGLTSSGGAIASRMTPQLAQDQPQAQAG